MLSVRDIFEKTKGRFRRVSDLQQVLGLLVERGYIHKRVQDREGPGRKPSDLYEVNPLWASHNSHNSQNPPGQAAPDPSTPASVSAPEASTMPSEVVVAVVR